MPRKSGLTNRDVVNHGNGKGDKTRVTDVQAYRRNFDEIEWSPPVGYFASTNEHRILRPDEIVESFDEFWSLFHKCWRPVPEASVGVPAGRLNEDSPVRRPT